MLKSAGGAPGPKDLLDLRERVGRGVKLSDMPTFDQVLEDQLSDPRFRDEWERTRLAHEVATELVRYRAEHSLTQAALARRAGVSRSTIARLEAADHEPSLAVLTGLAKSLGLSFHIDIDPTRAVIHVREHPEVGGAMARNAI
jgi:DNA-binding XRE family transcriptional regulator